MDWDPIGWIVFSWILLAHHGCRPVVQAFTLLHQIGLGCMRCLLSGEFVVYMDWDVILNRLKPSC